MHLTKHHGLGNDFLIVLDETNDGPVALGPDVARRLCDRHAGLGADGLIHGARPADGVAGVDVVFRLWNSDGSEAEVSGNGLRCLAHAVARVRAVDILDLTIATVAGARRATVRPTDAGATADVEIDMGPVTLLPDGDHGGHTGDELDANAVSARAVKVSVGNPHWVHLSSDPFDVDLPTWGPRYERDHDGGINVEFIAPAGPDAIDLVVWERGSGITQACGSGATAAAHVAREWGLVGDEVEVRMPGGSATVTLSPDGARLRGPSTFVAEIEVPDA